MLAGAAIAEACTLTPANVLHVAEPALRVSDIVTLACVAPQQRAHVGHMVLAEVPEGVRSLTRTALARLMARRAHINRVAVNGDKEALVVLSRARSDAPMRPCYETNTSLAADEVIDAGKLRATSCRALTPAHLSYDAASARLSASEALPVGAYLGPIEAPPWYPDAGDTLTLQVSAGPVSISRTVTALQVGARSHRIFVRDADGHVFTAPLSSPPP